MHDMRHGICGLCGHDEVLKTVPTHRDWSSGDLSLNRLAAVQATLGELTLYVCAKCGYAQWFVEDSEVWQEQARPYVSRIQGQPGAQALNPVAFEIPIQDTAPEPAPSAESEPDAPRPEPGEVTYDVRIQSIGDPDLIGAVALKMEELVSIPRNEAMRIALEHGFVDRDVDREEAEQIKQSLEEVPGVAVVISRKAGSVEIDLPPELYGAGGPEDSPEIARSSSPSGIAGPQASREIAPAVEPPGHVQAGTPPARVPAPGSSPAVDGVKCRVCEQVVPKSDTFYTDDGQVCSGCYRLVYE